MSGKRRRLKCQRFSLQRAACGRRSRPLGSDKTALEPKTSGAHAVAVVVMPEPT